MIQTRHQNSFPHVQLQYKKIVFQSDPENHHTPLKAAPSAILCQKKFPLGLYIISDIGILHRDSYRCHRSGLEALQWRISPIM